MPHHIPVVLNQRRIVILSVVYGGDADTGTSLQRSKEGTRDAVDEPHGHPVELPAAGVRGRSDFVLVGVRSEKGKAGASGGGSSGHGSKIQRRRKRKVEGLN